MSRLRLRPVPARRGRAAHRTAALALGLVVGACGASSAPSDPSALATSVTPAATAPARSNPATSSPAPAPSASAKDSNLVRTGEPWIVYQLWDSRADIRLVRPDGSGDHPLLAGAGTGPETTHPDWSPAGDRVAYVADNAIWVAKVDGTDVHQVTTACPDPCSEDYPAWSPDGSSIAYGRWQADGTIVPHGSIVVVDLASGEETMVLTTDGPEYPAYPRWSPDGRWMVVALDRFVDRGVETKTVVASIIATFDVHAGASSLRRLTNDAMFGTYPDWSPDGKRILLSTYDLGYRDAGAFQDPSPPSDLFVVAADGSDLAQITHNDASSALVRNDTASGPLSSQPSWSPDGTSIIFVQTDGTRWPGWGMAVVPAEGGRIAPAAGIGFKLGTHPRLRPLP